MTNEQLLEGILPDPDLITSTKIDDPIGAGTMPSTF